MLVSSRTRRLLTAIGLVAGLCPAAGLAAPGAPDAAVEDSRRTRGRGAPKGEVLQFSFPSSQIFPGTERDYFVYVPAQYQPEQPACVYVGQDGIRFDAPAVFDRLIARKQMPVTIGVFVMPGRAAGAGTARPNRSLEYDSPNDTYARFLLEELLPDVETRQSSDGRPLRLSKDGNDRAIGGASSGGLAAFTAAWEKPTEFSRVFSAIGSFVGLRGADRYPTWIRKFEPRPVRVFLQDGASDQDIYGGDWWMANQMMARALTFSGHDVAHAFGKGGHDDKHATAVFPRAMRWLWRDWPQRPSAGQTKNRLLAEILIPGEDWELVGEGYRFTEGPTVNARGEVFFNDIPAAKTYKVGLEGQVSVYIDDSQKANGQAFGPDGRLYAITGGPGKVVAYDDRRRATVLAEGFSGNDLVVAHNGNVYVTSPPDGRDPTRDSNIWLVRKNGDKQIVDTGLRYANGVALSPDQRQLYASDHRSRWAYAWFIQPDGTLTHKTAFYALEVPIWADSSSGDGMHVDDQGRLYVATRTGLLQIADTSGRTNAILPTPNRRISNVTLGGEGFDTLFVTSGDRVFRRKINARGVNAWAPPLPATGSP